MIGAAGGRVVVVDLDGVSYQVSSSFHQHLKAVCSSVLQCVAVCCSVLQCVVVCCSVVSFVAVCCSVLQCRSR